LRDSVTAAADQTRAQCHKVSQVRLQIEAMEADLRKNMTYHSQLESIIDQFNDVDCKIHVPFKFFYDLYKEQEREVVKLSTKVKEAENLAEKLLQEALKKKRDSERGHLIDADLD